MSKRPSIRLLLIALLTIVSLVSSSAQNPAPRGRAQTDSRAAAPAPVPRVAVETFTLDNGLQVIVSRRPELPVVAVNTWYHVGPANEAAGRTGFAHLFEHMMFQASKHVPEDSFFRLLESAGASDINGSTSFDFTNYYQTLPANQVELALWLESDRMGYLLDVVDEKSFANQQDIVRNERRQRTENAPYGMAEEAVFQMLFPKGHPYHGVVIGSHEDIQAAKLADVKQFFKEYYGPNNATVSIVGDINPKEAVQLAQKYFGSIKRGPAVKKMDVPAARITSEQRRVVPSRIELPKVYMAWITPPFFKPGDAEADVTATILGGGRSSRLYKKLVYERQIAQNVTAYQYSLSLGSTFQIEATARPGHTVEELEKAIDEEIAALAARPPDVSEVTRARNQFETSTVSSLESISGLANRLNVYNHYVGSPDYVQADFARYSGITPASVQTFVRDQLKPSARVVVHAVPGTPDFGPPVPTPPAPTSAAGTGHRVNQRRRGVAGQAADRRRGPHRHAADADDGDAAEWPDAAAERATGVADRVGKPGVQDGERRQPARQAGAGQLRRRDARRGHDDAQRAADCRRSRAARRLVVDGKFDGLDDRERSCAVEELRCHAQPDSRRGAAAEFPSRRNRASACQSPRRPAATTRKPSTGVRASGRGRALRSETPIRLQRDRYGSVSQGNDA